MAVYDAGSIGPSGRSPLWFRQKAAEHFADGPLGPVFKATRLNSPYIGFNEGVGAVGSRPEENNCEKADHQCCDSSPAHENPNEGCVAMDSARQRFLRRPVHDLGRARTFGWQVGSPLER